RPNWRSAIGSTGSAESPTRERNADQSDTRPQNMAIAAGNGRGAGRLQPYQPRLPQPRPVGGLVAGRLSGPEPPTAGPPAGTLARASGLALPYPVARRPRRPSACAPTDPPGRTR